MLEEWLPVPGYEDYYEVSNTGKVRSFDRIVPTKGGLRTSKGKMLSHCVHKKSGYPYVNLHLNGKGNTFQIHQLVALAFIGERPEGFETCHNNGVRTDNRVENLRYDTPKGNQNDRKIHGTNSFGEGIHQSKITEKDVREIRRLRENGLFYYQIAELFPISKAEVHLICKNKRWQHVK